MDLLDVYDYMRAVEKMKKAEKKRRHQEMLDLLGALLLALLAATPWSFIMACLAVKAVTG